MKSTSISPSLRQRLIAPLQRLQWKLTLSYTLVTVGANLSIVLLALMISVSYYLLPREHEILPRTLAAELRSNIAAQIRPYLEADPPDLVGLQDWFTANQTIALPSEASSPNQVTIGGASGAQLIVVGPDATFYAASTGTQFISGTVGSPLDTSALPALKAPLQAALAGETDYRDLSTRSDDEIIVAAPVMSANQQRVIGALLLIAPIPAPVAIDIVGPAAALLAGSAVVLLIWAGSVGTVFGFITARGLSGRLARLANVTGAWSQGDFSAVVADTSQDELGQLARRLERMAEQLQNLLNTRRELAVVEERNRMARDLHDSVKQQAFAASAQIGAARTLIARDPVSADRHLGEAERLLDTLREELNTLILELRPAALGDQGLATALQAYAADWSHQTGIEAVVRTQNERSLPVEIEQALFRIAQEALANTARHSSAQHADLWLGYEPARITLKIADNGQGFDMTASSDGFGLHSMQDRAEGIGAQISIESRPAEGTRITVTCPIHDSTEKP